ncbi:MAG: hypothetical protein AAGA84_10320 [Pseudomonadota bacterium]
MGTKQSAGLHWSDVASVLALVLSVAALFVAIIEANTTRDMAKAEAWPFLSVGPSYNSEGFSLLAVNKGVGPARIRDFVVSLRGKPVENLDQMILDVLGPEEAFSYDRYRSGLASSAVVSAGETLNIFWVDWDPASRKLSNVLQADLEISICYCSVYDDCWQASMRRDEPEPVSRCP